MSNNSQNLSEPRKRLLWRACHRGIKEMDIIIGGFAAGHLADLPEADLEAFAAILELPDQDMLAWLTGQEAVPAELQSALLTRVLSFRPASVQ
jgi:antitoxin CptB